MPAPCRKPYLPNPKFVKRIEKLIFKETLRGFTGYTKTDKLYSLTH